MQDFRNRLRLILVVGCFLTGGARADIQANCEFQIESGSSPVRMLGLSAPVYACMRHSSYRDIRIVNGDGNTVPILVEHPSSKKELADFRKPLQFNSDTVEMGGKYHRRLRRMVRSISYRENDRGFENWVSRHAYLTSMIVENPETEARLNRIHIKLENPGVARGNATAYLEYSDDLSRWTSSSFPQKLFYRQSGGVGFQHQQLLLGANRKSRYLRVVVMSNIPNFVESIDEVEGIYQRSRFVEPEYVWTEATSIQQLTNGQDWQFSVPDQLPVSRIRFQPSNGIVYYSGLLMSKPIESEVPEDNAYLGLREGNKKKLKKALKRIVKKSNRSFESANSGWRTVTRFRQFHSEPAGESDVPTIAEPIYFSHRPARHWRITFKHPSSEMIASRFPTVEFGWTAARVRFLAQGPEPFVLQAGVEVSPRAASPNMLRGRDLSIEQVGLVQTDESRTVQAEPGLREGQSLQENEFWQADNRATQSQIEPEESQPDRKSASRQAEIQLTVWVVMVLGVLVMAYMSWQLIRKMENKAGEEG